LTSAVDPSSLPAAGASDRRTPPSVAVTALRFGPDGLVPAIVQDEADGAVLMLAWMDRESLTRTLADGTTVFFSRSRQELWPKGATSGHVQHVVRIEVDCDADALLVTVRQTGVACHTGARSCFHRTLATSPPDQGGDVLAPVLGEGGA
jgi:phosphoribosyl-ATP pyrophosphohydrolase/phosphoribosyl-AMP cyclohydrolase